MDKTDSSSETMIVADEIGEIPAPVGAAAGAIHARITIERDRLKGEEAIEAQLTIDRKRLLVEGTDADIDEIERRIDTSRGAQVRILERVDLLRGQLIAANEQEESNRLDGIAARGNRAREYGEALIREYGELAPKLAGILERLAACEDLIEEANNILHRAKRDSDMVSSPNRIRCRPRRTWTEVVRKMVGPREPGHPLYGTNYHQTSPSAPVQKVSGNNGVEYDVFVEADAEVERTDYGDRPQPLHEAVNLPDVGPELDPNSGLGHLWQSSNQRGICGSEPSATVLAEVRERIEREPQIAEPITKRAAGKKTTERGEA